MSEKKVDINKRYKSAKGVLRAVKALFEESPSNWTRHMRKRSRKTANGGVAFCATGGIEHFAANPTAAARARELLRDAVPGRGGIESCNDSRGRKVILASIDKALAS
jgi:hypothetical protein